MQIHECTTGTLFRPVEWDCLCVAQFTRQEGYYHWANMVFTNPRCFQHGSIYAKFYQGASGWFPPDEQVNIVPSLFFFSERLTRREPHVVLTVWEEEGKWYGWLTGGRAWYDEEDEKWYSEPYYSPMDRRCYGPFLSREDAYTSTFKAYFEDTDWTHTTDTSETQKKRLEFQHSSNQPGDTPAGEGDPVKDVAPNDC